MIGQIIQSYLVSLGVQIDKPGFQQADATIKQTGATVEKAAASMGASFGAMAANFVKASTIIGSALAGVTASVAGLMNAAAKQDLAMQKYAASMMMGRDAAEQMKRATDALGESIADITLNPELTGRFKQLAADGGKMRVGGDFKETMKNFRDLIFEFTRLKQEASYAMTWIGYYLQKYLQKPLADIKENFRQFNDAFIKNMSVWTEKAARAIVYILNIGKHFLDFLVDVGKALYKMWDSFPKGAKIAIAAITAIGMAIKASPMGRMIMLVSTLLLLIDDYYGYMEGKQAAFGEYWDKLNGYIERGKQLWEEIKPVAEEYWDRFTDFLQQAKVWAEELATKTGQFLTEVSQSEELQGFIESLRVLGNEALQYVVQGIRGTYDWLKTLYKKLEDKGTVRAFTSLLNKLYKAFIWVVWQVKDLVHFFGKLYDEVTKTEEYKEFTDAIAEMVAVFLDLLNTVADLVGASFRLFFGEMQKTDKVYSFRDAIRAVFKIFSALAGVISTVLTGLKKLFDFVRTSDVFTNVLKGLGKVIDDVLHGIGKIGRALLALKDGKFQEAWSIVTGNDSGKLGGIIAGAMGKAGGSTNEERIWSWLKAEGFTDEGAAGVMGNLRQEAGAGFDPTATQDKSGVFKVDGETGFGLVQWTDASRQQGLLDYANSTGGSVYDLYTQLNNMKREAVERGTWDKVKNATNVEQATKVFHDEMEGSDDYRAFGGIQHRYDYGNEILGRNKGQTYFQASAPIGDVPGHRLGRQPMESSLEGVWWFNDLQDWIGGVLQQEGAGDAEYSSGARTIEHNARVGGAENSYHVYGDAVDIVLPDGANTEAIKKRFEPYFKEVLYHDVGSGLHLHLGGYKGNMNTGNNNWDVAPAAPASMGSGFMSDGGPPMWQRMQKIGRNPSVQDLLRGMHGGGGSLPPYALPSTGGGHDSHDVSIGDIIVQIQGGANATAEELANRFKQVFPQAVRDAGFFAETGVLSDLT